MKNIIESIYCCYCGQRLKIFLASSTLRNFSTTVAFISFKLLLFTQNLTFIILYFTITKPLLNSGNYPSLVLRLITLKHLFLQDRLPGLKPLINF